jgi:NAD kinase
MDMGDGPSIAWFSDKHATAIRVQRTAENIEEEIALAYKTDAKTIIIFWLGGDAILTAAFEVVSASMAG